VTIRSKVLEESSPTLRANLASYDSAWSLETYAAYQGLFENERALVDRYFPHPPARVLDLGCGAGRTTGTLHRLGFSLVGIDFSSSLLEVARHKYPDIEFLRMDALNLQFPDASFDAALFSFNGLDCIHPVSARRACLRGVFRVLRPGGVFIMSSHNLLGLLLWRGSRGDQLLPVLRNQWRSPLALSWFIRYLDGGGPQHLYSAPPGKTVRQLGEAGFEVLEVRGVEGASRRLKILFSEHHVDFVARRPRKQGQ